MHVVSSPAWAYVVERAVTLMRSYHAWPLLKMAFCIRMAIPGLNKRVAPTFYNNLYTPNLILIFFNVFVEVKYTVYFPFKYFVINGMFIVHKDHISRILFHFRFARFYSNLVLPVSAHSDHPNTADW